MNKELTPIQLVDAIVEGILRKKGKDVVSINLTKFNNAICNYFIICHGDSNTHVGAIAESVLEYVRDEMNERAWGKAGFENSQWICLDYLNVVVHIFQKEYRDYYHLEDMWADAEAISYQ